MGIKQIGMRSSSVTVQEVISPNVSNAFSKNRPITTAKKVEKLPSLPLAAPFTGGRQNRNSEQPKDPMDFYKKRESYSLQIDSHALSSRQGSVKVNNYYRGRINKHIFKTPKPSPILISEATLLESLSPMKVRTKIIAPAALLSRH